MIPHCDTNKGVGGRKRIPSPYSSLRLQFRGETESGTTAPSLRPPSRPPSSGLRDFISPAFKLLRNYCVFLWSADAGDAVASLTSFPSALSGKRRGRREGGGDSRTYTATQPRVSVSWLWMAQPAPKCETGGEGVELSPTRGQVLGIIGRAFSPPVRRRPPGIFHRFSTTDLRRLSS